MHILSNVFIFCNSDLSINILKYEVNGLFSEIIKDISSYNVNEKNI